MVGVSKIVFGNAQEMKMLAFSLNLDYESAEHIPFYLNNINRVTVSISNSESKDWLSTNGIFVMTQGGQGPAIVVWGHGESVKVIFKILQIESISNQADSAILSRRIGRLAEIFKMRN